MGGAGIANRNVLADVQVEVAATGSKDKGSCDRRGPDNFLADQALDVLNYRISVIAGLAYCCIGFRSQDYRIGTVDPDQAQLAKGLGDRVGILNHVSGQGRDGVAGPLANALDSAGGVAFEDRAVFGKGYPLCRILKRLPVRVVCASLHVVDRAAVEFERHAQLHHALNLALASDDSFSRRLDIVQMASADGGQHDAARLLDVHYTAPREVAL